MHIDLHTTSARRRAAAALMAGPAVIVSFAVSMLSHWLVGAARSVFTGRSVFRSGIDMFVVGLGVAVVGFYAGEWISALF